jgi:WD40 repeat protein
VREKYVAAMKEKMLISLERDRLRLGAVELDKPSPAKEPIIKCGVKDTDKPLWKPWPVFPANSVSHDGDYIYPNSIRIFGEPYTAAVSCLAISEASSLLASGADDGAILLGSPENKNEMKKVIGSPTGFISGLSFHPSSSVLSSSSGDGLVTLWGTDSLQKLHSIREHNCCVWSVVFSPLNGSHLLSASMDHTSKLIDVEVGKSRQTFRGHTDAVNCANFCDTTQQILTASADKSASFFDVRTGNCLFTLFSHSQAVNTVASRGSLIATGDCSGSLSLTEGKTRRELVSVNLGSGINGIAWISDQKVACACKDGIIRIFDTRDNLLEKPLCDPANSASVLGIVYSNDLKCLFTSNSEGVVNIW